MARLAHDVYAIIYEHYDQGISLKDLGQILHFTGKQHTEEQLIQTLTIMHNDCKIVSLDQEKWIVRPAAA